MSIWRKVWACCCMARWPIWMYPRVRSCHTLVPAVLLGLINLLAAVLPLMDSGNSAADQQMLQACRRLLERARLQR